ncbi:MAG: hypothetical protein LBG92_05715 [Prevotellaceae bacterium]|nr:hypothetical protein [Prevotellaceae bacterium]
MLTDTVADKTEQFKVLSLRDRLLRITAQQLHFINRKLRFTAIQRARWI